MSTMQARDQQLKETFTAALASRPAAPRGVVAQIGMQEGRRVDRSLFLLAIHRIRPDADQVRRENKASEDTEIRELAESIRQFGILNPLSVRYLEADDTYEIVAGERRYTAAKLAGLSEVPVKLLDADEQQSKLRQLHENIHRASLLPLELAAALQELMDGGATLGSLAKMLGKSETYVQKALTVAGKLTEEAKALVQEAERPLSMEHLYEASQVPSEQQAPLIDRIRVENLSRQELREVTAAVKQEHKSDKKGGRPTTAKPFSKTFSAPNGAKVTISFRKAKATAEELRAALQHTLDSLSA